MHISVLGIDLGKNSCSVVGLDDAGRVIMHRRVNRDGVVKLASKLPPCVMAMEVCCGAHHLGRLLDAMGHQVRLVSLLALMSRRIRTTNAMPRQSLRRRLGRRCASLS